MNNLHLISHQNSQGRGEREWLFGSTKGGADKHFLNKSTAVVAKIEILKQDVLNICLAQEIQSSLENFCLLLSKNAMFCLSGFLTTLNLWLFLGRWKWPNPNNFASVSYSQTQSPDFPNPGRKILEYSFFPLELFVGAKQDNRIRVSHRLRELFFFILLSTWSIRQA